MWLSLFSLWSMLAICSRFVGMNELLRRSPLWSLPPSSPATPADWFLNDGWYRCWLKLSIYLSMLSTKFCLF